ncbi:MAG: leucine--tRNA ligase [Methanomassiliicoccales archaeon]|jgi:leucyl-tRNA synthetase|nr:leucine--tRNA ligase [Methanomassiliicoccales archaeon]
MIDNLTDIERKWQERWYDVGINESEPDNRPKFMIIFAYPGVTGYLHVGHLRGYTYVDAIARYMRMNGYNVLFPVGTHATGNGAISLAKKIKARDKATLEYMFANGCPESEINNLEDPIKVVHFFNDVYINQYWKRFGFLADWRRFTCTIYPDYQKFIQWQFRKLMAKGLLIQKPYFAPACIECGPVAVDPSETDLQKGGRAEIVEYTLLKFKCGELFLVAATLRPETVFGQTNFWVNPDVEYVKVRNNNEIWVISRPSFEKMKYQKEGLEIIGTIGGKELVGKKCIAPMIHREIMVLPAKFCDPSVGTGLVTSVPSDAPDDWIALKELQEDETSLSEYGLDPAEIRKIKPIPIIDIDGWGPLPAVEIVEKMGIERSGDTRLEEAKKIVYRDGFHKGKMNDNCGQYAGLPVQKAKELMRDEMVSNGEAELFYDLSEEVICRCGKPVVIKKVPDQWFIDYGNKTLTEDSKRHARTMHILPPEYYANIQNVLDWFRERACVRQGNWLGTRFPFDEKWIIEAISDSTLYPIYYLVSKYVNEGSLKTEQLTEDFFDYVFLGEGDVVRVSEKTGVDQELLRRIREDVEYWYPLDINLGGKEHMTVHFPAFLMNHVGILQEKYWPRGIFVNWYITGKLGKISKSKGGAEPIPGAAERFGVDTMRLYYAHIASPFADVEWDEGTLENYKSRIDRILKTIEELRNLDGMGDFKHIDRWMLSRLNSRIRAVREGMRDYDLRRLANEVYFEMINDIRWYLRRGGKNRKLINRVLDAWIRMMAPITPHIAEELWENSGKECFVSTSSFPNVIEEEIRPDIEEAEEYLKSIISDINEILDVTGITPRHIRLYTSPKWKLQVLSMAVDLAKSKELSIPGLMKMVMKDQVLKTHGKEASDFARKTAEALLKCSSDDLDRFKVEFDEFDFLNEAAQFLKDEFGCEISVHSADDPNAPDPQKKARLAVPRRPAIYVE